MPTGSIPGEVILKFVHRTVRLVVAGSGPKGGIAHAPITLLAVIVYIPGVVYVCVVVRVQGVIVQIDKITWGAPSPKLTAILQLSPGSWVYVDVTVIITDWLTLAGLGAVVIVIARETP